MEVEGHVGNSDVFGAHASDLEAAGNKIKTCAGDFESYYLKIYEIIGALIGSEWSSPAASLIAKKIEEQRPNLDALRDVILGYSNYCFRTKVRVERNEEEIMAAAGGNENG